MCNYHVVSGTPARINGTINLKAHCLRYSWVLDSDSVTYFFPAYDRRTEVVALIDLMMNTQISTSIQALLFYQ